MFCGGSVGITADVAGSTGGGLRNGNVVFGKSMLGSYNSWF